MLAATFMLTVTAFLLVSSAAFTAADAEDDITYIDENGTQRTHNDVTIIDGSYFADFADTLYILNDLGESGGWYLVRGTFVLNDTIFVCGEVHLILENDCDLSINGSRGHAGIDVSRTNSLTIYGQPDAVGKTTGTVVAKAGVYNAAGIGGGYIGSGGIITINGGAVTATGGSSAAGIGGGYIGSGGIITINGGAVTATGGSFAAGIGGGENGSGGTITINGGTVKAEGGSGAGIGGGEGGPGGNITINGGDVTANGAGGAGIGCGNYSSGGNITITGGTVKATGGSLAAGIGGGSGGSGGTITVTGGDVTASSRYGAGIGGGYKGSGGNITITGGTVKATGGSSAAGIGGGYYGSGGNITINGGDVTAAGGSFAAGIGGGYYGSGGNITINGGTVTADGGMSGAGIGGGENGSGGTITINGGTVNAEGGAFGAGIGGGENGSGGTITINGGDVTANGAGGAGIGGGYIGSGGNITITGGDVTAVGDFYAAGIGGGTGGASGDILIYGESTKVTVKAGLGAQFIGCGAVGDPVGNVFVILNYENLTDTDGQPVGNKVMFTAFLQTAAGVVTATLPFPFDTAGPDGNGKIDLIWGLGPDALTNPPSEALSVITSFTNQTVDFALDGYSNSTQHRTGDQLIAADASVDFFNRSYFEVTVNVTGPGSVELSDAGAVYGTVTESTGRVFKVQGNVGEIFLTATADTGYELKTFIVNGIDMKGNTLTVPMDSDKSVTAVFVIKQTEEPEEPEEPEGPDGPEPKKYTITAASDSGSTISPAGKMSVSKGSDHTFVFSVKDGYVISAVAVNGKNLTLQQIGLGSYTFFNVIMDCTIEVKSEKAKNVLIIDIVEGKGHAEYSLNGGPFMTYYSAVALPDHADIVLRAYADDGYGFKVWMNGTETFRSAGISLYDITASVHLDLYFADGDDYRIGDKADDDNDSFPWWAILLLIAGLLLLLILFRRRKYDVVKAEGPASVIGEDKVRRKSAYSFLVEGGAGSVSYRIGGSETWKTLSPDADGEYLIPKGEITDNVTIVCR